MYILPFFLEIFLKSGTNEEEGDIGFGLFD